MNEFVINKNSWHYRFLAWYKTNIVMFDRDYPLTGDNIVDYENLFVRIYNFCEYWRAVLLWPALRFIINISMVAIILALFAFLVSLGTYAVFGLATVLGVVTAILLGFGFVYLIFFFRDKFNKKAKSGTGFVATAYSVYKNKFCPFIIYEEKN